MLSGPGFSENLNWADEILKQESPENINSWPLIILLDDLKLAAKTSGFLWQVFTRFDPAHDIYAKTEIRHHRLIYHGPIVIDARMKPDYPGEVIPAQETVDLVNRRWKEYNIKI